MRASGLDLDFWVRSELDERALLDGCYIEPHEGIRVLTYIQTWCIQSMGQWDKKPFVAIPWQRDDIIMPFWSWKRANGTRRFRRVRIWMAKKNGKSTLCSVIVIVLATFDNEPGAQVYTAAVDVPQARIVFDESMKMIKGSPMLLKHARPIDSRRTIFYPETNSLIRALAADSDSAEGLKAHAIICDEIHAWKNRKLRAALRYSGRTRRQPSDWIISTAGFDEETIGFEEYQYSKSVKDGATHDTSTLVHISETPEEADWTKEENWKLANPSWNALIDREDFRADFEHARTGAGPEADFRRYSLNQWTQGENPAIRASDWDKCEPRRSIEELIGAPGYGGLDLAPLHDFSSFCLVFPEGDAPEDEEAPDDRSFDAMWWYWIPEGSMAERKPEDQVRFRDWAKRGLLTIMDDDVVNPRKIRTEIVEIIDRFKGIREIVYDPHMAQEMAINLAEDRIIEARSGEEFMVMCPQNCGQLNEPSCALERLMVSGNLRHGNHPIARSNALNLAWKVNSDGLRRPAKKRGSRKHIDGMSALINGLKRALVHVEEAELYEGGMTFLDT